MLGKVIGLTGGLYTVVENNTKSIYKVKAKGVFRHRNIEPIVGDNVTFDENLILSIDDRKNFLVRPKIANIDYVILISPLYPEFSFELLDKFLVLIEKNNIEPIIVVTKCDKIEKEKLDSIKETLKYYSNYYNLFYSSYDGLDDPDSFKTLLKNKICIFSGQTGAGKSHLLNTIDPTLTLKTQEISEALGRGKHTTREVSLYKIDDMYIADSPGFSKLDLQYSLESINIKDCFPEFRDTSKCKFQDCNHITEPGCEIKKELDEGLILKSRYDNYLKLLQEKSKRS